MSQILIDATSRTYILPIGGNPPVKATLLLRWTDDGEVYASIGRSADDLVRRRLSCG
jgi:hypothetical protein